MGQSLRQIAERAAGPWLDYREAEVRADRAAGRKATTSNGALLQRRHADFEDGLLGRAKAAVLALRFEIGTHAAELRRQMDDLARERDEHIGEKLLELREMTLDRFATLLEQMCPLCWTCHQEECARQAAPPRLYKGDRHGLETAQGTP